MPDARRRLRWCNAAWSARARSLLAGLVASGPVTAVSFQGHDRYGRDLARVSIAGQDVAAYMIGTGLARPYAGHQHPDWCAIL